MSEITQPWFAVRCVLSHPTRVVEGDGALYEERITLWKSGDWAEAYRLAGEEAAEYAEQCGANLLATTDAFHLFDEQCGHGSEVWSVMRGSHLDERTYIETFCTTTRDRCHEFVEEEESEHGRRTMAAIAEIGTVVEVTPWDDIWIVRREEPPEYLDDPSPFRFRVEGRLEDGQIFYGLYGPVIEGPERYRGLVCSVMVRSDGTDWREETESEASFRVGPGPARRDHRHDFRHPEGTVVEGYPVMGRFGGLRIVRPAGSEGRSRGG